MDPTRELAEAKARLRAQLLERRRRRPAATRALDAEGYARHLGGVLAEQGPGDVAAFLPLLGEPAVLPALERAHAAGRRIWMPAVQPQHRLAWVRWHPGAPLAAGNLPGLCEPVGPRHGLEVFAAVRVLLVPVVAVDRSGVRLGFGGGYYDRFLPSLAPAGWAPEVLACCHADEVLPTGTVPREAHDAVLTRALTERGALRLGPEC